MLSTLRKNAVAVLLLSVLLVQVIVSVSPVDADEVIEKKVALHKVKGKGVTDAKMDKWLEKANEVWKCSIKFVKAKANDEVDNVGDGKVEGAMNIYGSDLATDPPGEPCKNPGNPGYSRDEDRIEVGKDAPDDTLAHELGHWLNANPDNTAGEENEHGNPQGQYPDYPGYKGSDTDGDGDHDADDRQNIMYPGKKRTGQKVDDEQQKRARENAKKEFEKEDTKKKGGGKDETDRVADVIYPYVDLTFTESFFLPPVYNKLFLTLHVQKISFDNSSWLGFLIESDNNPDTGEAPEGIDYRLRIDPMNDLLAFERYDHNWIGLDTTGVAYDCTYIELWDGPYPPVAIGITFTLPWTRLERRTGNTISYTVFGQSAGYTDKSPDQGLKNITKPEGFGGFAIPTDKLSLLSPYIAFVALVAGIVSTMYAKKRRLRKLAAQRPQT